jgi:hypothetical protein
MLRPVLSPSGRGLPNLWKSALQHPGLDCADFDMKVAKRGVFDRFRTLTDREEGFGGPA